MPIRKVDARVRPARTGAKVMSASDSPADKAKLAQSGAVNDRRGERRRLSTVRVHTYRRCRRWRDGQLLVRELPGVLARRVGPYVAGRPAVRLACNHCAECIARTNQHQTTA